MKARFDTGSRALAWLAAALFGAALATALAPLQAAAATPRSEVVPARMQLTGGAQTSRGALEHGCECPAAAAHAQPMVSQQAKDSSVGEPLLAAGPVRPQVARPSGLVTEIAVPADAPALARPQFLLSSRLRR